MNSGDTQIDWAAWQRRALLFAVVGLAIAVAGWIFYPAAFYRGYMIAFCLWLGASLGSLAWVLIFQLTGGAWGVMLRRTMEASARCLPLMALAFLPIAFSLPQIYVWAVPANVEASTLLQHKAPYLNIEFFQIRAAIYFVIWIALAMLMSRYSRLLESGFSQKVARRYRLVGAGGLVLYAATITFASVDWVMSLTPDWYSTMFPVIFAIGQFFTSLAFSVLMLSILRGTNDLKPIVTPARCQDLGSLLLALTMLWAYTAFSQFMLIWTANLPEENAWYQPRMYDGWKIWGICLIIFQFIAPFALLLLKENKRDLNRLRLVAILVLVMRVLDLTWQIVPSINHGQEMQTVMEHWAGLGLTVASIAGIGGLWMWLFVAQIQRLPLVASRDPRTLELLHHE